MPQTPHSATNPAGVGVTVQNIRRTFHDSSSTPASGARGIEAVAGVTLTINPGEFVAILGPSGCGKSTLLRILAGLERLDSGTVGLFPPLPASTGNSGGLAFVFQDAHLLPWRNTLANVALPLELMNEAPDSRREKASRALEQVGLADAAQRYPAQLSGGMKMRASLARALVTSPRLLLLDEPFAALDEITRQGLDQSLRRLWLEHRMTVLFVTHSINEAAYLADRAVVLTPRPARIVEDRPIDLPADRPASLRGSPEFAAQVAWMLDALRRGGAHP